MVNFNEFTCFVPERPICFSIVVVKDHKTRDAHKTVCDVTMVADPGAANSRFGSFFRTSYLPEEAFLEGGCKQWAKWATFFRFSYLIIRAKTL